MALTKQERLARTPFQTENQILDAFKNARVNTELLEESLLKSTNSAELYRSMQDSLKLVYDQLESAEKNAKNSGPTAVYETLKKGHGFLMSLADVSPAFRTQMREQGLLDLNVKDLAQNQAMIRRYKDFLTESLRSQHLKQVHYDLVETLRKYFRASASATQEQANRLRESVGTHHDTMKREHEDFGAGALDAMRSNSIFEPAKRIGHFLSQMYQLLAEAPHADKYWAGSKFSHSLTSLKDNEFMKLNNMRYGNTGGAGQAAPMDAGPSFGRPGPGGQG